MLEHPSHICCSPRSSDPDDPGPGLPGMCGHARQRVADIAESQP